MVAWQNERGAGGCLSFEELNSIVSVLSAFSWSLFLVISLLCQIYAGLESTPGVVIMFWTAWFAQLSVISKELVQTEMVE